MNKKYKYHPIFIIKPIFTFLSIFLLFFQDLIKDIFTGNANLTQTTKDLPDIIVISIIIYVLLSVSTIIKNFFSYKKSYLEINETTIVFNKSTLFGKKYKSTSISQISNIQLKSGIIDKIFRTVNLQLDIDSSETASLSDYNFLLSKKDAEEFKEIYTKNKKALFHISSNEDTKQDSLNDNDMIFDREYSYTSCECFQNIFYEVGPYFITIGISSFILSISDLIKNLSTSTIIVVVFYTIYKFIKLTSKYYAYTVKSNDKYIYWKHGLLSTREFTIEKNNIKSVNIKQTLFARIANKYSVEIKVVGVGNSESELKKIILYTYKDLAIQMLAEILPDKKIIFDFERESIKVGMISSLKYILASSLLLCLKFIQLHIYIYFLITIVIFIISIIISKGTGINIEENRLTFLSSIFGSLTSEIEFNKIEHLSLKSNFIMKKFGLYKIELYYKDSNGAGLEKSGYFELAKFDKVLKYHSLC